MRIFAGSCYATNSCSQCYPKAFFFKVLKMEEAGALRDKLILLLQDHGIGVAYLSPMPRGGRLRGPAAVEMEQALDGLVALGPAGVEVEEDRVFGNGCFAVGRYRDAARVYSRILLQEPEDTVAPVQSWPGAAPFEESNPGRGRIYHRVGAIPRYAGSPLPAGQC